MCIQAGYSKSDLLDFIKRNDNIIDFSYLNKHWILTKQQFQNIKDKLINDTENYFNKDKYASSINKEELTNISKINTDFLDMLF